MLIMHGAWLQHIYCATMHIQHLPAFPKIEQRKHGTKTKRDARRVSTNAV